jgi:hypothetical protein
MTDFLGIDRLHIPQTHITQGMDFLRIAGKLGKEGMFLLAGTGEAEAFSVTELIIPEQEGIRAPDGVCVIVGPAEMHRLNVHLYRTGLRIILQAHSHPTHAYHSAMDDEYAIANNAGSFSMVVPDFAVRPFSHSDCALYRLSASGRWMPLDLNAKTLALRIKED